MVLQKYRLVDSYLRRWKVALGAILTSSLLLTPHVLAASTASTRLGPTVVRLASLQMETPTVGWATDARLANPTALFGGQILHTVDGGRQWTNVTPPHVTFNEQPDPPSLPHNTMTDFLSGFTAWTVTETATSTKGMGTLLLSLTQDGGHHWHQWKVHLPNLIDQALSDPILKAADFLNPRDGWLEFGPAIPAAAGMVYPGMELWHTANGGRSWTRVAQIPGRSWIVTGSVTFTSPDDGWMIEDNIGNHSPFLLEHTSDGGRRWSIVPLHAMPHKFQFQQYRLPTFSGSSGVLVIANGHATLRTTDWGHQWKNLSMLPTKFSGPVVPEQSIGSHLVWLLTGICKENNKTSNACVNVNSRLALLRSTNAGGIWTVQSRASFLQKVTAIDSLDARHVWILTNAHIWRTVSAGKHWTSWKPRLIRS